MRFFGRKKKTEPELTEDERRKKRKKTLRNVKSVKWGDSNTKRTMMDEITDIDQYTSGRRRK